MSVPVDVGQLAEALSDFTFAYLITVGDDFHAHTVAVDPVLADEPARSPYDAPVTDAAAGDAPASGPYTPPVTGQPSADAPRQTPDFRRPDGAQ